MNVNSLLPKFALAAMSLVLVTSGCGDSSESADTTQERKAELTDTTTQNDVAAARLALNQAETTWEAAGLENFELRFDNGTDQYSATIKDGVFNNTDAPDDLGIPLNVVGLFHEMGTAIKTIENDATKAGTDDGGCEGVFFEFRYDKETGTPALYDRLSPCDDGAPWNVTITSDDF